MILLLLAAQAATLGATNYGLDAPMPTPKTTPAFADERSIAANGGSTPRAMPRAGPITSVNIMPRTGPGMHGSKRAR
jgi:hypothetical protein